ncbi:hypothetical protein ACOMHN_015896 [Nucella lapillus]
MCRNLEGVAVVSYELNQQACLFSHATYVTMIYVISLLILAQAKALLVFRYRWHFRLVMYGVFRGRKNIVDNIVHYVEGSKKVIMLFSSAIALSAWCQFRLSVCLSHVLDYDYALIIACLDDVWSRDMTAAMIAVMRMTTCIQWRAGSPQVRRAFWGRVKMALQEVIPEQEDFV